MPRKFTQYAGCCITSDAESIHKMVDRARDVTYEVFTRNVPIDVISGVPPFHVYAWGPGSPGELRLKNDWAVSFHKSHYRDKPCYYIQHSRIEYIFVEGKS